MHDQNIKADAGKLPLSKVPRAGIKGVAAVRAYGIQKYGDAENWRQVEPERYVDAAYRHFFEFLDNWQSKDAESGLYHIDQVLCNLLFVREMVIPDENNQT